MTSDPNPFESEIARAIGLCRNLMSEYVAWGAQIEHGAIHQSFYTDVMDFVNFRFETADSCLALIERNRVADALGLSRSLMENYLLLMLVCRGFRYVRLQNLEASSPEEFEATLAEKQRERDEREAAGERVCVSVSKYPRAKRHIMYVFEGLASQDEPEFRIPAHYFFFREFRPETMRLRDSDYFVYYPAPPELQAARREHRAEALGTYRHYLSYDALLQSLRLNELLDDESEKRVEAHYTFLGRFLHPTHDAARQLRVQANHYGSTTEIGLPRPYTPAARLLAVCYVAYLLAGLADEMCRLIKGAPAKYIKAANTEGVRRAADDMPRSLDYFWFLFNEPPLYDRWNYAIHHLVPEDYHRLGGAEGVPADAVTFDMHIYSRFEHALGGWENRAWGVYVSPLTRGNSA